MRAALEARPGIHEKKMFGGYCWMLNGNMLCGVEVGPFMFRVGRELEAEALARPGATTMDITGKPMRGIVRVRADAALETGLNSWIDLAERFVRALPAKQALGDRAGVSTSQCCGIERPKTPMLEGLSPHPKPAIDCPRAAAPRSGVRIAEILTPPGFSRLRR
ncbi:MAG: TfoX/Sxy family protein [Comamonadaceae bacterium]|nr:TfoX/Sxy family protein [Comamonadaceae bacterium]